MSQLRVETPPAAEPVTLPTLKNHLRISINDDDSLLAIYLQAAREAVEAGSGRSLVNKLYRQSHDHFPHHHGQFGAYSGPLHYREPYYNEHHHWIEKHCIKLLRSPLVSVQKIVYLDQAGVQQTLLPTPGQWIAENIFAIGDQIGDPNGNLQQVTAVTEAEDGSQSESGADAPAWPAANAAIGTTTADGDLTWTKVAQVPADGGDFLVDADSEPPRLAPLFGNFWPATLAVPNAVQIFYTAGYGNDANAAPAVLKVALMQSTGVMYEHREALTYEELRRLEWFDRLVYAERVRDFYPTP
jgi:hypothetical protein